MFVFPCCIPVAVDTIAPCVFLFCDAHTVYMAEHAVLVIVLGIHCSARSPQPELTSYFVQFLEVGILGG